MLDSSFQSRLQEIGLSSPSKQNLEEEHYKQLARYFNTELLTIKNTHDPRNTHEFQQLMTSPGFKAVLKAIDLYAQSEGVDEKTAAHEVISAFKRIDEIWTDFILHEGIKRIKSVAQNPNGSE